jgi:hypothetical protein
VCCRRPALVAGCYRRLVVIRDFFRIHPHSPSMVNTAPRFCLPCAGSLCGRAKTPEEKDKGEMEKVAEEGTAINLLRRRNGHSSAESFRAASAEYAPFHFDLVEQVELTRACGHGRRPTSFADVALVYSCVARRRISFDILLWCRHHLSARRW